jgi:hypothetical protein
MQRYTAGRAADETWSTMPTTTWCVISVIILFRCLVRRKGTSSSWRISITPRNICFIVVGQNKASAAKRFSRLFPGCRHTRSTILLQCCYLRFPVIGSTLPTHVSSIFEWQKKKKKHDHHHRRVLVSRVSAYTIQNLVIIHQNNRATNLTKAFSTKIFDWNICTRMWDNAKHTADLRVNSYRALVVRRFTLFERFKFTDLQYKTNLYRLFVPENRYKMNFIH